MEKGSQRNMLSTSVMLLVGSWGVRQWREKQALEIQNKNLREQSLIQKSAYAQLQRSARYDELTGFLRKAVWKDQINQRIESGQPFGVIFMDMDAFKKVNDKCSHEFGDGLLDRFGKSMLENFRREKDSLTHEKMINHTGGVTIGRYGGDEFGLLVDLSEDNERRETDPLEQLMKVEARVADVVKKFSEAEGLAAEGIPFGVSIGSALWLPGSHMDCSEIVEQADLAMYANKHQQRA